MSTAEPTRICIAATFTAEPVAESVEYWCERLGLPARVGFAPYHQVFQQLYDPTSVLRTNADGVNVVWVRWDDLAGSRAQDAQAWREHVERNARELGAALMSAASQSAATWLLVLARSPRADAALGPELLEYERALEAELAPRTSVHVLDRRDIERRYPVGDWHDAEGERFGHVPFTRAGFAAVGSAIMRRVTALRASPRKVIVLDCDNTLWRGVVGEDGVDGVVIDAASATLQGFMAEQSERGRLICLASKNDEADVLRVFDRPEMRLRREHLVSWRIDWSSKADNVAALAAELDLGLDSFIFVDDNPVECAEMRARHPQVLTLELPERTADVARFLEHAWAFDQVRVTDEDRVRTRSYQVAVERERTREHATSLADFIAGLGLRIEVARPSVADIPRLSQLTQRTNQFNSTTVRMSEADVRERLSAPGSWLLAVRVADRFGDYGLVGMAVSSAEGDALRVEGLLLSCRTLGRGVEHEVLAALGRLALRERLSSVVLDFVPSARNQPVLGFLESLEADKEARQSSTLYRLDAAGAANAKFAPEAPAARAVSGSATSSSAGAWPAPEVLAAIASEGTSPASVIAAIDAAVRSRPELGQAFVPPSGERERAIAAIWREVLRLRRVGARDRFSDLGGSSIQLVRVHGLLLERLGIDVNITTLFQHPTVAELAAALENDASARLASVMRRAGLARQALASRWR